MKVVDLPKSDYYYYSNYIAKNDDENLLNKIIDIKEENPDYGYRRVTLELHNRRIQVNHKKVQRVMQENGLQSTVYDKKARKYNSYKGTIGKIAPNRLNRRFQTDRPYQKLTSDVTELRWGDGSMNHRAYLEPIYDLYNGEVLSFNIDLHPTVAFALKRLKEALNKLPDLPYRTTVHTVQGFQYQNQHWVRELKDHHVFQSMSRKATCLDNAAMESFFHILKCEIVYSHHYLTYEEVKTAITKWIHYYNNQRIKEKLGGKSPVQFRILTTEKVA